MALIQHQVGRPEARARRAGIILSALGVAGSAAGLAFFGLRLGGAGHVAFVTALSKTLYLAGPIASGLFGAIIVSRQPPNKAAWAIILVAVSQGISAAAQQYGHLASIDRGLPFAIELGWFSNWMWVINFVAIFLLLLLFPDGRLPAWGWRFLVAFIMISAVGLSFVAATLPFLDCCPWAPNPLALPGDTGMRIFGAIGPFLQIGLITVFALCVLSVIHRYARAGRVQRTQLKWLIYAGLIAIAAQVFGHRGPWGNPGQWGNAISELSFYALPAALAIAILRYRLYDIDRLINRTVVYGLVTAGLAGLYLGMVLLIQVVTPLSNDSPAVVAISTLVVAALFRPARSRAQSFIDRRFNRARYDAAHTLAGFTARLRDEVDLDSLGSQLVGVVTETMQPEHTALWLRPSITTDDGFG